MIAFRDDSLAAEIRKAAMLLQVKLESICFEKANALATGQRNAAIWRLRPRIKGKFFRNRDASWLVYPFTDP
jgi:hypothetical protein